VAVGAAIVDAKDTTLALYREGDFIIRSRNYMALCIQNLHCDVHNIAWSGSDALPVCYQTQLRRGTRCMDLGRPNGLTVFYSRGAEGASRVRYVPRKMEICCRLQNLCPGRIVSILPDHAGTRKGVTFDPKTFTIEKELHCIAVGIAGYSYDLPFSSCPIPMWREM
jgi:hypothetical protein